MALNLKENQELYLIFEDGHSERVIDGVGVSSPLTYNMTECFIKTEQGFYKLVETVKLKPSAPFINSMPRTYREETWYKYNDDDGVDYEEIHGVHYYVYTNREKEK